jgi:hypothetical protein
MGDRQWSAEATRELERARVQRVRFELPTLLGRDFSWGLPLTFSLSSSRSFRGLSLPAWTALTVSSIWGSSSGLGPVAGPHPASQTRNSVNAARMTTRRIPSLLRLTWFKPASPLRAPRPEPRVTSRSDRPNAPMRLKTSRPPKTHAKNPEKTPAVPAGASRLMTQPLSIKRVVSCGHRDWPLRVRFPLRVPWASLSARRPPGPEAPPPLRGGSPGRPASWGTNPS